MALFSAFVLTNAAGAIVRNTVMLVRKDKPNGPTMPNQEMVALQEHVAAKYAQRLAPLDIEVVDAENLKAHIKKLNKAR